MNGEIQRGPLSEGMGILSMAIGMFQRRDAAFPRCSAWAAVAVIGLITSGAVVASTAQTTRGSDSSNRVVVHDVARTDGYTISSITSGNVEVRTTAPAGSTFDLVTTTSHEGKSGSITASVTTPNDKGNGVDPDVVIAQNKALGRSVITEVMTMGVSYEDAVRDFGSMMAPDEIPSKAAAERTVARTLGQDSSIASTASTSR